MIYGNLFDTVVYELARKKYDIHKCKIDDFENKKRCHNVLAIIENNYNKMENITSSKELSVKFDSMNDCKDLVFEIIKQAHKLIDKYKLKKEKNYQKIIETIEKEESTKN